ncbi:MAG: phenylacetate--CoA ligase family protein [Solirubrobacterales bacterium]
MIERLRRVPQVARALRLAKTLESHDQWSFERLRAHQRQRLLAIVRHAAANSPYYRERFAGIELSDELDLRALPRLDKATMLENFDELVTDRRLTLAGVEQHLKEIEGVDSRTDPMLFGEYRAMASGGTSGRRGVFVYGRGEWTEFLAGGPCRAGKAYLDVAPRLPRRRFVTIAADHPLHGTGRMNHSLDVGAHRFLRLDARTPIGELAEALNAFRPESLTTYPSTAALLAERQLAGELRIAPRLIATGGEVRTPEMEARITDAWGRMPFNIYGATETGGYSAVECDRHAGLHLFEDQVLLEVVDDDCRPVPDGKPGSRLLITNLYNRTQPLIRYELNDLITVSPDPCPCGRPFPLLTSIEGRSDDVLEMPATDGGTIKVHPLVLRSPLAGIAALSEYRIVYGAGKLRVEAVLADADGRQACDEIGARLGAALAKRGAQAPPIGVESVAEIPRHPHSGKHKVIEVQAGGLTPPRPAST